jgi:hypothetical protein
VSPESGAVFPLLIVRRNIRCDSCGRGISGDRLFCLDCTNKDTEVFNPLDLCCDPQCISQRITSRQDIEGAHEPSYRLVKVHVMLPKRQFGIVYTDACAAFERMEKFRKKIAEYSQQPQEKGSKLKTGLDTNASSSGSEPTFVDLKMVSGSDKLGDAVAAPDGAEDGARDVGTTCPGVEIPQDATDALRPHPSLHIDLPKCGNVKCKGPPILSFPFWYCIYCTGQSQASISLLIEFLTCHPPPLDDLFICDVCETDGIPILERSFGHHTEMHDLILCQAPVKEEDTAPSTEERLVSIEGRLDGMQSQFDDLRSRLDDLRGRFDGLDGQLNDLTYRLDTFNSRFGHIEQLLHKLVGTVGNAA